MGNALREIGAFLFLAGAQKEKGFDAEDTEVTEKRAAGRSMYHVGTSYNIYTGART
jgi:hypothetical protein